MKKLILQILFGKTAKGDVMELQKHTLKTYAPSNIPKTFEEWSWQLQVSSMLPRTRAFIPNKLNND